MQTIQELILQAEIKKHNFVCQSDKLRVYFYVTGNVDVEELSSDEMKEVITAAVKDLNIATME